MEVNGKEFIRNVGIEQDKEKLYQEHARLEAEKRESVKRAPNYFDDDYEEKVSEPQVSNTQEESAYVDLSIDNNPYEEVKKERMQDIFLDNSTESKNKKKYVLLGLGLIILFIITILVIRLISNSDTQQQLLNSETTVLQKDQILDKIDTNEEYQKVIDKKVALDESDKISQSQAKELNEVVIPEQNNKVPMVIDTPKPQTPPQRDLFGLEKTKKTVEAKAPVVKKVVKKKEVSKPKPVAKPAKTIKRKVVVPPPVEKNFTKRSTAISGYFIQIGAFTKKPSDKLLNNIAKKGYNYRVHSMTIKGRVYNKVLIGSYTTKAKASSRLNKIRKDFKNPGAYILKF